MRISDYLWLPYRTFSWHRNYTLETVHKTKRRKVFKLLFYLNVCGAYTGATSLFHFIEVLFGIAKRQQLS